MEKVTLFATKRKEVGKKVGALRRAGKLPAVIYGYGIESTPITLELRETTKKISHLTSSSLVTIDLEGEEHTALIQEIQRDYILNIYKHIDFLIISLTEKLRTNVNVELEGVAPAVKDYNGVVVLNLMQLDIESLPQDLPERITIDISDLKEIGDSISVKDISLPENVEIHNDPDDTIVVVTATSLEPELEEGEELLEEATGTDEPEVIERGKKEEEEE